MESVPCHVILIGMPGSGKSTVGRLLARQLNLPWVDCDSVVEQRIGCSIKAFFEVSGEVAFRAVETRVLADLGGGDQAVISTGGGVVVRPENRVLLRAMGQVVYLRSDPHQLFRRLRHDTKRPLLQGGDALGRLKALFEVRDPLYRESAHYTIETRGLSASMLAQRVFMQIEQGGLARRDTDSAAAPFLG